MTLPGTAFTGPSQPCPCHSSPQDDLAWDLTSPKERQSPCQVPASAPLAPPESPQREEPRPGFTPALTCSLLAVALVGLLELALGGHCPEFGGWQERRPHWVSSKWSRKGGFTPLS